MSLLSPISGELAATGTSEGTIELAKDFSLSLRGTWVGTVLVERSFDDGVEWGTVESFTENTEKWGYEPEGALYRVRCSAYTSGTILYRLGK